MIAAVREAARRLGLSESGDCEISIDTEIFRDVAGRKLGLGSSAATAVVAAALVTSLDDETALGVALEGHRAASGGEGSGIDVAASFYGGVIAARRQPSPVSRLPSILENLELSVLFTGQSASTRELVRLCRASPEWGEHVRVLGRLSEEGVMAWQRGDASAVIETVWQYGRAMADLGKSAGAPVVTDQIAAIMRLAREQGLAAKPSGAGGGDVVVIVAPKSSIGLVERIGETTGALRVPLEIEPAGLVFGPGSGPGRSRL